MAWKLLQTITFTSTAPVGATVGGTYLVSATGGGSGNAVTLSIAPASASVCSLAGSTVSFLSAGTCVVRADQAGNAGYVAAAQVTQSFAVSAPTAKQSQTITFTSVPPSTAHVGDTYDVTATGGGSGNPVVLMVAGGACSISGARVSFDAVGECRVTASQAGNSAFLDATPVTQTLTVSAAEVVNPTITAEVSSTVAPRAGWYRKPVRVEFTCAVGSAPLTTPCPEPVVLDQDGADQAVTRSVAATDGGFGQVTLDGIGIDQRAPRVKVKGVKAHRTYRHWRTVRCTARDSLSGPEPCRTVTRNVPVPGTQGAVMKVKYRAIGKDLAGNKRVVRSWYLLRVGS